MTIVPNNTRILAVLMLFSASVFGQVLNDYRTNNAATDWSNLAHWERYNGATWVAAAEYPGQTAANANVVTIRDGHTASLTADVPNTVASIVVGEGASGILTSDHASNSRVLGTSGSLSVSANGQFNLRGIALTVGTTTTVDGTILDDNDASVVTYTGLVTVNASGTFTTTNVTTKGNLVLTTGLNNSGTLNFGGATFGDGATLTSGAGVNFPNGADCSGSLNLAVTGVVNFQAASAITTNLVSGANTSTTFSGGNSSVGGTYNVPVGQNGLISTTGTFAVTSTSQIDGTFTDNDNTAATTLTGLVTVPGTFTTTAVTTKGNLVLTNGLTNTGTLNLGGVTFGSGSTLSSNAGVNIANGADCPGTLNLAVTGIVDFQGATAITTNLVSGANTSTTFSAGNSAIGGTYNVPAGQNGLISTTGSFDVTSTSQIDGTFTDNDNTAVTTLTGLVTVPGTFTSTAVTTKGNLVLTNGITNTGTLNLGGVTFGSGSTLTSNAGVNIANGADCPGTLNLAVTGIVDFQGATAITTNLVSGANTSTTFSAGNSTIGGTYNVPAGQNGLISTTGTFDVTSTSQIDGTLTDNDNTAATTFTGLVTVPGTFTTTAVTTKGNLVLTNGITNTGTLNLGGVTFGSGSTLTSNAGVNIANGADCPGTLNLAVTGTVNFQGATAITTNLASGANTSTTFSGGNSTIGGTYNVESGQTGTVSTTGSFSAGASTFDGAFVDNDNTAATTFTGLVTVGPAGSFATSTVTTTANLVLGAGIANAGTVTMPTATFTGTGPISGAGTYTIGGNLVVSGAVTVTNSVGDLTVGGTIDGTAGGSTWVNDANTTFRYEHATAPMATGVLTANNANSNFYYSLNGNQAVKGGNYTNLFMTAGGIKTSDAAVVAGGTWNLASGVTFDPDQYNFDVTGASTLAGTLADGHLTGTTTIADANISGGTIDGAATGVVNITGTVTLPTANPTIGRATLTFSNTLTVPSGRTVTFNANAPTGVKTFGTVVVDAGGTWTSTLLNTKPSLVINTAFTNNGTASFGGATFGAGATLTSGANVDFPNGADCAGTLNANVTGTIDFQDASAITTNLVAGAGCSTTFSGGNSSIGGTYNVPAGATGTVSTTGTFSAGATTLDGAFVDNDNTAATTFTGLVTVNGTGTFTTSTVTTTANLVLGAGIANAGTVTMPTATFNGTGPISGAGTYTIGGNLLVSGAVTVTNSVSDLTVGGTIDGTVAGSTWINDANTTFRYEHATAPMATGVLTANNANSNFYYSLNGNQAIKDGAYTNLFFTAGGTKSLTTGNITVGGDWTLASGVTFDPDANDFTVTGSTTLAGILADGAVAGTTQLNGATNMSGGTIDGAATGVVNVAGAATLPTANPTIGRGTITFSNAVTIPSGRTITFNANSPTGVKTFGTVTVDAGGVWNSALLTTPSSLVVSTAFTNNGTSTFGGADISGTLTSVNDLAFPNGLDAAAALQADITGNLTTAAASTFASDLTLGATTVYTMSGAVNNSVGGNLDVANGTDLNVNNTGTFLVSGTTQIDGDFADNDNSTTNTLSGLVTVGATGTFNTSTVTTTANLVLGAGIANAGTVTMPTATFNGTGPISGAGTYTIGGNLLVSGAVTVTNSVSDLTVGGTIDGTAGGSTWVNDANTTFRYEHATAPMATGVLTANNANSNFYYSLNGNQAIKDGAYTNLFFTAGGTKSLTTGNITVGGTWDLASGVTFDPDANDFTVTGATTLAGILADGAVAGTTQLNGATDMSGGTIDGSATGVVNVAGAATLPTANPTIGRGTITFSNAVTIPNGRTITFNANSPTGVKTFGTVTVDAGGTWTSSLLTTQASLVIQTAFNNSGTTTFGGATFNDGATLTSNANVDFPNGVNGLGTLNLAVTGTVDFQAGTTIATNLASGANTNTTFSAGNHSIGGTYNVEAGRTGTVSTAGTFSAGASTFNGAFVDNDNTAATTFTGLVTVGAAGSFTTSTVTTTANLLLGAGLANAGTVTMPTATFNGTGPISGAGTFTIGGNLLVSGAVTVTNSVSDLTVGGTIDGTVAGSTWIQDANTTFRYEHATAPMMTGVLTANNANANFYYSLNGNQAIKDGAYTNLFFTAGGTKSLTTGNITVGGDWTLASGVTFDPDANDFSVTGTSTLTGTLADGNVAGTTTLGDMEFSFGTIDGTATGVVNVTGAVTMVTSDATIGRGTISFTNTLTIPTGRTLTFNANAPTGVKTFGTVTVDAFGTWNSTLLNTQPALVINTAFNNNGASTFGGATFADNAALNSGVDVTFPNGVNGLGTLNMTVGGTVDFQDATTIATNLVCGAATSTTFSSGNSSIGGTFNVEATRNFTVSTTGTFTSAGATINGNFLDNDNTAATSFTGMVTIGATGTFTTTALTTLGNLNFSGGFDNEGTLTTNHVNFNGTQTISGGGTNNIGGDIIVDGAVTVTNQIGTMTVAGVFNGNNAASTWLNDVNTNFHYQNATEPMQTGVLTTNANNSNFYYDLNGNQNVKDATYYNLLMNAGGTKTSIGNVTVDGDWTLASGVVYDPVGFDFTVTGASTLAGTHQDSNAGGTTTLGAVDFSGGTIDGTATGVVNIASMTMPTVANTATIGRGTITVTGAVTVANTTSLVFNANSATGVKTFNGLVTVSNGGTWTATNITTPANLMLNGGFDNDFNATTFGGATITGTLSTVADLAFPDGLDGGAPTLTVSGTGTVTVATAGSAYDCNYNNLATSGTITFTMLGGNNADPLIGGTLNVGAGTNFNVSNNRDFGITGTTTIDGTFTRTTNGQDRDMLFTGVVTVSGTGALDLTAVTDPDHVYFVGGLTNAGTTTFTDRVQFGPASVLTATVNTTFPDGLRSDAGTLTINGPGSVIDNRINTNTRFYGRLIIGADGIYDASSRTNNQADLLFDGGITVNNTSSTNVCLIGRGRFNLTQTIEGAGTLNILNDMNVDGGETVTNNGNVLVGSTSGRLDAANGASTWVQGPNSTLTYAGTVRPMDNGVLDASGVGNTVTYNTTAVTQDVKQSTYYNLVFSPTNNADAFGAMTVTNELTLTSGTFDNGGNLTMGNNATIIRNLGSLTAAPTFGANVNIIYTANLATGFEMPAAGATSAAGVLNNLTFNTSGGEVTLDKNVSVKGDLTWSSDALVNLGDFNFRYGTGTITGVGTNAYLKTNGTGTFIKEGASGADFQITYPVGNTYYSPCQVTAMTAGAGDVVMRVVGTALPYIAVNRNGISKYWEVSNTAGATGVSANFTFEDPNEVVGSIANYEPQVGNGATHGAVTGPSANGATPVFSMAGHPNFTGDFTYIDATVQTPKTFWSFQSGNWNDPNVWSTTAVGYTNTGTEYPGALASGDSAIVKNSHAVTGNVSIRVGGLNILAGGIVDVGTQTGHVITNLNGQGTLKLNSLTLPTVTNNDGFVGTGGGTIEYYNVGGTGTNLPVDWMTYCNLTISNSTATDHTLILQNQTNPSTYTLNGDLSISATSTGTATLQLGHTATNIIDLSIAGDLNLTTNAFSTVGNFNVIHSVNLTGDLTNNGTIDWCNTPQYQQFVNVTSGAARLFARGASDKMYTCNGPTDVFQLLLYMGTDATYVCEINPSVAANWRVFSLRPNGGGSGGSDTPTDYNFDHAYFIDKGTLKFSGASYVEALGRQNAQYRIEEGDRVWLASGTMNLTIPNVSDGTIRMTREGELRITGGTLTIGDDGFNFQDRGRISIEGGTVNTTRFLNMYPGDGDADFNMSGGTLNIREVDTEGSNDLPRFQWTNPICAFSMSGGTINVYDPMSTANMDGGTISIMSDGSTVTGGTWNFYLPASNVDMKIASAIPMWDVNVYKQGAGTSRLLLAAVGANTRYTRKQGLTVLNDLTIDGTNSPIFDANGETVTVGGNFNIVSGGTYQGASQTIFTGTNASTFTIGSAQSNTTDLSIQKTGAGSVTMAGAASFDCIENLEVTGGTFDIGATVPLDVAGNVTNAGTIQGAEQLRLQRGVVTANVTASGYTMPTIGFGGGAGATFNITIKDGRIIDVTGSGGAGYGNARRTMTVGAGFGGAGADIRCQCSNNVDSCWVMSEGSGYGPTVTITGGGGTGATAAAILTGDQGGAATLTIDVVNPGEGYTSAANYNFSGGTGAATDATVAPNVSGGTFRHLSLNNYQGATATSDLTLTGNLRLANGVLAMDQYALNLGTASTIYDGLTGTGTTFDNTKMVSTAGLTSNGGIAKAFNGLCFVYPLGIGANYMEENLCFSGAPTAYGTITVKPVSGEHPLVSATGQSLAAYWNISSSGTTLGAATVSHTMKYPDAYVVDNGTTVLETEYVAGRYAAGATAWTSDAAPFVNAATNTGTVSGATFNTVIDGAYTFGDRTPVDPFASVTTYYSRSAGTFVFEDPNAWSIDGALTHGGAAAASAPTAGDVVVIGDGVLTHTMTVGANSQACAFITISPGSTLDLGTTTGHNFGTYTSAGASDGTLRISSAAATAEFPAGDWANFNDATGGTVEYYTSGAQSFTIPATSAAPTSAALTDYRNLVLTPATGDNITTADVNMTIHEDFTVQGASATGLAYINTAAVRTFAIGQDFKVTSGNAQFRNGNAQAMTVARNVEVSAGAILDVENAAATTHTLEITGDLVNDGTINFNQDSDVDLTFVGTGNTSIRGTTGGAATTINNLTVNKGTDQTAILDVTVQGAFTPPTNQWFTLTNGTFRYSLANTIYLNDANNGTALAPRIPATGCFSVNNAGATVYLTEHNNGQNDLYLDGKLEIIDGAAIVGRGLTNQGGANDIEYASTGTPTIDIQGGSLYVNGQIRRDISVAGGDLNWNQTGGTVTINGRRSTANKGKLEVLNNGVFNMSAGTIILNGRENQPTTFVGLADIIIEPASSTVTGGTIQFGITGDNAHNNVNMTLRSSVALNDITVDGNTGDTVSVQVSVAPLTINGTLTIANEFSAFDCNGADLIFTENGSIVNNNTRAIQGVTSSGFYPGVATQNTTFQSTTAAQSITGTAANMTNFGNLTINNTFGNVSIATGDIAVHGNLTITTTLADGGRTVNAKGNVVNNGTHSGTGSITMNGSTQQDISGTGTYENIGMNNSAGVLASSDINLNGTFTLTDGVFDLNDKRLDVQTAGTFAAGAAYSTTNMIITTGAQSDLGVRKNLAVGATDITYPVGVTGKYCPVRHNVTANTAPGTVTVKPINTAHPSTQDPSDLDLDFYWNVTSTGTAGLSVDHYYTYEQTDVDGTEANYRIGVFRSSNWTPAHGFAGVNDGTNLMTLAAQSYLDGDFTAGESDGATTFEFATLATFYSRQDGAWNDNNTWSTVSHVGPPVGVGVFPGGNPTIIGTGHDVTITNNSRVTPSLQINGTGSLDLAATFGHNFGTVTGTGTIRCSGTVGGTFFLPLGDYTAFVADGAGTWEYYGTNNGTLPAQFEYNNLMFTGASTKSFPLGDVVINSDFTINSGVVSNTLNNVRLTIEGNWVNSTGGTGFSPGTGTVELTSATNRAITGSTEFYDLVVNNTGGGTGTVTVTGGQTISNSLTMTSGLLDFGADSLILSPTATITSPGFSATRMVQFGGAYTDGGVFMNCNTNPRNITLPMGSGGLYTPASYNLTAIGTAGTINVRPVAAIQPFTNDVTNKELTYYWNVTSTGLTGLTLTQTYTYDQSDVVGTEANYKGGHFQDSLNWVPVNGHPASVNTATNVISIPSGSVVAGDYTAGESDGAATFEFGPADTYYSITTGNFNALATWSIDGVLQHTGAATTVLPRSHNAMVVGNTHVVTIAGNDKTTRSVEIASGGELALGTTTGHNFRDLNGAGTIRVNCNAGTYTLPEGEYDDFVAAAGGTINFISDCGNSTLPDSTTWNGVELTGGNTISTPAIASLALNGGLSITGTVLDNSTNNTTLSIGGDFTNAVGFTGYLPGTETVTFNGTVAQTIDGNTNFQSIGINNTAGVTIDDSVNVASTLAFTDGILSLTKNMLLMQAGPGNITGYGTTAYISCNDTARLKIPNVGAVATVFPIGTSIANGYAPVTLTNIGNVGDFWVGMCDSVRRHGVAEISLADSTFIEDAVNKTWFIKTDEALPVVEVMVAWHSDAELPGFTRNNCSLQKHFNPGNSRDWRVLRDQAALPIVPLVADYYTASASNVTSFSPFAVGRGGIALPVELLDFYANKQEEDVALKWVTGSEVNNDRFEVERSTDGINFEKIATVRGNGNTDKVSVYHLTDTNPSAGINYYRLKQIDFDGEFEYSSIRAVNMEVDEATPFTEEDPDYQVSVYPNPSSPDQPFSVAFDNLEEKSEILVIVTDVTGREFYSKVIPIMDEDNKIVVVDPYQRLQPGIYLVTGSVDNSWFNKKLIVE